MKELIIKTEDNIKIAVNHFSNNFDEVLVICPGWFMTKDSKAFMNMALEFSNYMDVMVMDFRGHGKSSGLYTFMSKETLDLKAVVKFARDKYKKVYLLGFSLGGGIVIIHSAVERNVDKVIAVSAPADFYKIENHIWHPDAWIPTLFKKFEPKRWLSIRPELFLRKKLKPLELAGKITCPVLFAAGEKDPTVFAWHTKSLFDNAVCDKKFQLFEGGRHAEDLFIDDKEKFMTVCLDWLNKKVCANV